uniref:DUF1674 domain-containing protein n=1 Tax=Candidatus Kentrum sp. UNK TaxID=2126344 RepID=A0A451AX76_9GAMM|nr:MAG: Protein of unknown function (DUF1674) [Candidatus Kentron sp. UNK]VFK70650.1 MAG: Protein of unknown function (DUF1674) [Candidatus Kentron sp. UNK]
MVSQDKKNRQTDRDRADRDVLTSPLQGVRDKEREAGDAVSLPREVGGPSGLEPTRYGDWEKNGRCIDF